MTSVFCFSLCVPGLPIIAEDDQDEHNNEDPEEDNYCPYSFDKAIEPEQFPESIRVNLDDDARAASARGLGRALTEIPRCDPYTSGCVCVHKKEWSVTSGPLIHVLPRSLKLSRGDLPASDAVFPPHSVASVCSRAIRRPSSFKGSPVVLPSGSTLTPSRISSKFLRSPRSRLLLTPPTCDSRAMFDH